MWLPCRLGPSKPHTFIPRIDRDLGTIEENKLNGCCFEGRRGGGREKLSQSRTRFRVTEKKEFTNCCQRPFGEIRGVVQNSTSISRYERKKKGPPLFL